MREISFNEAKTQLLKYIKMIKDGEENKIVIVKNGKRVACLTKAIEEEARLGAGLAFCESKPFKLKSEEYGIDFSSEGKFRAPREVSSSDRAYYEALDRLSGCLEEGDSGQDYKEMIGEGILERCSKGSR